MTYTQRTHIRTFSFICSVAVLAVISSIMAYFTSTDAVTNKLVGSQFDIILVETKWNPEKAREVLPGDELDKNPQVINNERTDAYVFLRVTVPCDTEMVDNNNGTPAGTIGENSRVPMYKFMVSQGTAPETYIVDETLSAKQEVHSHWVLVNGNNDYTSYNSEKQQYVYVYGYSEDGTSLTPLKKGEITEPLFDKLQLWNFSDREFESNNDHSVKVEALGIQADLPNLTANNISEIWAILEGGDST